MSRNENGKRSGVKGLEYTVSGQGVDDALQLVAQRLKRLVVGRLAA